MSTFKRILAEKTRRDYGRKGGQGGTQSTSSTPYKRRESKAKLDNPQKYQTPARGPRQVIPSPQQGIGFETNAPSGTVLGDKTPEQAFGEIDAKQKKRGTQPSSSRTQRQVRGFGKPDPEVQRKVADDLRGRKGTDPTARKAASNILGGGRKTPSGEELVGGETAKSGRGQRYRQARPADVRASGVKTSAYADWQKQAVKARQQLKASGTKFFGKPTGVDAQGKPTYVPPKETPKGETGRRAQRQASPRSYASVKAEIEGAKGFSGSKSGGLETRSVPKPVTDYRQKRAARAGTPDPFDTKTKFSQKDFDKSLRKILKKQAVTTRAVTTANPLSQAEFKSRLVRGKNRPPLFPKPDFPATVPSTKPKPPGAPDRTATKQAVKDIKAVRQRLNVKPTPTTGGQVAKSKPATPPVRTANLAVRQGNPLYQGAFDAATGKYTPPSKGKVTGGTTRATDIVPSKRPTGTKTFAQFATSGRTAKQKQATLTALKTPTKVTAPPKPQALTKAAVAPKVKAPKITAGGVAGGALSALGAGFDVVQGRADAKKAGASDTRSWLRGAARAAGGLLGGAAGASAGLVGGVAGYSAGSALADKTFTALAGATDAQKAWMKQANLASQKGTAVDKVKYRKGNQAVIYDPRVKKERIGTFDPTSGTFKADNLAKSKAYTAKNPFERLGRQFSRSNEGSGLFGLGLVKGYGLADMAKKYYADKDERERVKRVSDFKKTASAK